MNLNSRAEEFFPALLLLLFIFFLSAVYSQDLYPSDESIEDFTIIENEKGLTIVGTVETSQQMEIIGKEEIEKHNTADLATLLQESLNLSFTRYGGRGSIANINLRGFDSKRVAVLVDGVAVNSVMDGKIDIDQIDLNSVERIEVIYGGSDTKYNISGAFGGVINIVTLKKQEGGLRIGASVSNTSALPGEYYDRSDTIRGIHWEDLLDTQNLTFNAAYGKNSFSITAGAFANRAANHFLFTDYVGSIRRKDNNEVWDAGGGTSFIWDFPLYTKLIVSSNFYYSDKNIPNSGFSDDYGNQRDINTRHALMLEAPRAFHDNLASETSLTYSFSNREYVSQTDKASTHNQHSIMAVNRWAWYPNKKITIRSGLDYRYIALDSTEIGNRSRHDGGIYITAEYKPSSFFLVSPSIKAVFVSKGHGNITPIPKLGLLFTLTDSLAVKNNYFRSFKFPDFEELYWSGGGGYGNPDLLPEDGWGGDLGLSWQFKDLFTFDNTFFFQWLKNSIHWFSNNSTIWRPENVGEAVFFGVDSKLKFEIPVSLGPVKKITPSVSYQYLASYLLSFGYTFSSDKRIPYMPAHTFGSSLSISWGSGSVMITAHYESLRFTDRANTTSLEPHFLLNLTFNQAAGKNFTFFSAVRNILNQSYESFYDYPMPGISFTIGVRTEFKSKKTDEQNE